MVVLQNYKTGLDCGFDYYNMFRILVRLAGVDG